MIKNRHILGDILSLFGIMDRFYNRRDNAYIYIVHNQAPKNKYKIKIAKYYILKLYRHGL